MSPDYKDPYYDRPEVSNSMLTELKQKISGQQLPDMTEIYAFGNLVDAMITEPDRIDWYRRLLDGQPVKDFYTAKQMYLAAMDNDFVKTILHKCTTQKVSISHMEFNHMGINFDMPVRCKWDFFGYVSGDIKTTAAKSQKEFETACMYFDYPRSRAWYMDIDHTNKDLIIGISKVNFKVFFYPIKRNDEIYKIGKDQYTELAFKWWVLG